MRLHSSQITGSLTVSGSIVPDGSGSWDLGSESHPWRDLHILSSSIKIYSDKEEVGRLQLGANNDLEFFDVRGLTKTQKRTFTVAQIRANATRKDFRGASSGKADSVIRVGIFSVNEIKMLKLSNGTEIINWGKIKRKAKETITIQPGDKIMVTYGAISKSVTGSFYGFDNGEISIQKFDKDQKAFYTIIPANLVAKIIVLQIKSGEYDSNYLMTGAASCGIIMGVLATLDSYDSGAVLPLAGCGAITGGLGGLVLDIEKQRKFNDSNEYTLLGKDAWYIDNHDIK